jgi:hypothetical protein
MFPVMSQERPQRNAGKKVSYYTEKRIEEFVNSTRKRKEGKFARASWKNSDEAGIREAD